MADYGGGGNNPVAGWFGGIGLLLMIGGCVVGTESEPINFVVTGVGTLLLFLSFAINGGPNR